MSITASTSQPLVVFILFLDLFPIKIYFLVYTKISSCPSATSLGCLGLSVNKFFFLQILTVLTQSSNPRRYWSDLKIQLFENERVIQLYGKIVVQFSEAPQTLR
jgi:hypothetical protein